MIALAMLLLPILGFGFGLFDDGRGADFRRTGVGGRDFVPRRSSFDAAIVALGQDVERQSDDGLDDVADRLSLGLRAGVGGRDEQGRQGDGAQ
jgi:hypothetical protein